MQEDTLQRELEDAVRRAEGASKALDESLRTTAFKVILEFLLRRGPVTGPAVGQALPVREGSATVGMQLNEFLALKSPNTHPDRVTTIAYYHHHERNESITIKDVADAYGRARLKKPQNVSDVIATCVRRGHLVDTEKKDGFKAWVITQAGDAAVEEGF